MQTRDSHLRFLLALIRMPGLGPVKIAEILAQNSDLSLQFNSERSSHFPVAVDWSRVDEDLEWADGEDCHIITLDDPRYPALLKQIHGVPPVLFGKGKIELLNQPQIAIVGSRNPTPAGAETAMQFAHYFSSMGITVTSGLALGIDACAHRGALMGKAGTIAVLGSGLKQLYPKSNAALATEIIKNGLLLSEFPLDVGPAASHFPRRNRLISGLSLGSLIVEAALKSGSLITAAYALEQGREVFAIPGSIHSPLSKGCHQLIREGAKLVETGEDVLEELGALVAFSQPHNTRFTPKQLPKALQNVLRHVGYEATSLDQLLVRCALTISELSSRLLELELEGCIISVPGGYSRVN